MSATASTDDTLRSDLVARLLEHLSTMSVTGEEHEIADQVEARYVALGQKVQRIGDSVVVGAPDARPLVLLVGHLDVVPPTDEDLTPRTEHRDGRDLVVGRGSSDMKSGNVIAMRLFEDEALRAASPWCIALVLYAGEEGSAASNQLEAVLEAVPWLSDAALAVVLEPTDGQVELGCLGGIHTRVTFHGVPAHSARPWQGRNAVTAAGILLANLDVATPTAVLVDGIDYRDVLTATQAFSGGFGPESRGEPPVRNVVPDRFTLNLNLRFAPSRSLEAAEAELEKTVRALAGDDVDLSFEVVDRAPPAPPRRDEPAVADFITSVGGALSGKQAWTDVARFAARGVPALNFGPGATAQAHQRGEWVEVEAMVDASTRLERFLTTRPTSAANGTPA